ncbi:PepSY-associated TM helix domain-containing protein [Comamonadaceae bacterium PP-2]
MARTPRQPKPPGIRQTMSDLHIWTGLLVGWILYAMFLTGTVSYFREEISAWMRPELSAARAVDAPAVTQRMVDAMGAHHAPTSSQWNIGLPTARNPVVNGYWIEAGQGRRGYGSGTFDPATGERVQARNTQGGDFFYAFHFNLHYMSPMWGRWIAGLCAMFMLVAIVSGVITHKKIFTDFFTFRGGKGQRSWLDAHSALSVLGLPFHFMITYSGLITLMVMYMPWGGMAVPLARTEAFAELSAYVAPVKPAGVQAPLARVDAMVREAEQRWGTGQVGRVLVNNAFDTEARVVVSRAEGGRVDFSPQFLLFDGVSGRLLQAKEQVSGAAETRGVLYGLHLGRFADTATRWLYFLVSLAGTAMVGTGLVLWTVKRRQKLPDPERPYFGFRLVERLNIASIAGLSVAMTAFLWGNRLLPLSLADRAAWEIHLFFIAWAATLAYACCRPAKRAWLELLGLAAVLLALLPLLTALTTDRGLPASVLAGDWVYATFDAALLVFAVAHGWLAWRTWRHRPRVKSARPVAGAVQRPLVEPAPLATSAGVRR